MTQSYRKMLAALLAVVLLLGNAPLALASQPFMTSNAVTVSNIIPPESDPGNKDPLSDYVQLTGTSFNKKTSAVAIYQENDPDKGSLMGSYWIAITQQQESTGFKDISEIYIDGALVWKNDGTYPAIIYTAIPETSIKRYAFQTVKKATLRGVFLV